MKLLYTLLFTIVCIGASGQSSPMLIKVYFNGEYEGEDVSMRSGRTETFEFGRMTLGLNKSFGSRFYGEIEVSNLQFKREKDIDILGLNSASHTHDVAFRYEFGAMLIRKRNHTFHLGVAAKTRYNRIQDRTEDIVQRTTREFQFTASIVPRLNYDLGEKFVLDMNGVLNLFHLAHLNEKESGRSMGERFIPPALISFRVGLGYKI